jgi:hypothetical protein
MQQATWSGTSCSAHSCLGFASFAAWPTGEFIRAVILAGAVKVFTRVRRETGKE